MLSRSIIYHILKTVFKLRTFFCVISTPQHQLLRLRRGIRSTVLHLLYRPSELRLQLYRFLSFLSFLSVVGSFSKRASIFRSPVIGVLKSNSFPSTNQPMNLYPSFTGSAGRSMQSCLSFYRNCLSVNDYCMINFVSSSSHIQLQLLYLSPAQMYKVFQEPLSLFHLLSNL